MTEAVEVARPVTGLILSGGGARAAYQVGVLGAIADLLGESCRNPFPVIVGTSAGAINAVGLACGALHFASAVRRLTEVWQGFHCGDVYRSDWPGVLRQASRFFGHSLLGMGKDLPVALLDSAPLGDLLARELDFSGIAAAVRMRQLRAVAVTAFGYESGQAVTFYQGRATIDPWFRHRRVGVPTRLTLEHLLASAAIPLIFPPVKVNREYFGDGAVRQQAPISPALHLGASRVLVVGVSGNPLGKGASQQVVRPRSGLPPTLAQISGHMLNSTFIDSLEGDIELLERLNHMSRLVPSGLHPRGLGLKPVDVLVISPSQPLDQIAARHRHEMPKSMRFFLRGPGATRASGAGVLSYLLFEPGYCNELIELGYQDAMAQKGALCRFLGHAEVAAEDVPVLSAR
ncbi:MULTISPECIES: patatin-like phospholipase family protein [Pseudomonadaceae]|jgi:NTE family protein|uniref:Patatin-like phospholipase family protein n=1 Tax=Aquipseudomonas alcaligenes TaxID=43263 RepID=A0AA42N0Z8_AQUAC|nr:MULTISPECIES: patatin-like phospholipase family protein [Pseudomonas]AMR67776.1 Patatin [Pseudomonas alcaligenes]MDC7826392.1 patatin-like phospholipase family protein [Pseudomonas sp. BLCC-B13]MDH0141152.1 patatin-like phospholipase family protein [Pseudomonas alcaligenes]MDH1054507.1 patatin-like phospholipase family protein [Pseudomonas alcaligenes]NMY40185.1 patatin-like phospholipase family protein [Pseudomonas sp. WS 5013]